jgi:cell wall-associated NlpC family hydrolase
VSAQALIAAARSYEGTRFHANARLPGVGLDCIGVIVCAALAVGLKPRDLDAYPMRPNGQLRTQLDQQLLRVEHAAPGDVLLMRWREDVEPHHVALYAGATLIHAYATVRKCVEQPMVQAWWDCVMGVYRFPELGA